MTASIQITSLLNMQLKTHFCTLRSRGNKKPSPCLKPFTGCPPCWPWKRCDGRGSPLGRAAPPRWHAGFPDTPRKCRYKLKTRFSLAAARPQGLLLALQNPFREPKYIKIKDGGNVHGVGCGEIAGTIHSNLARQPGFLCCFEHKVFFRNKWQT